MTQLGTQANPLRVAIIGSGPAGFYAAEYLFKQPLSVSIDMFDRLPTPFGLVRGGVAPDHQKIKSVTKVYEKTAANPNFRFFGHVEFGKDVCLADLERYYHAVIFAVGAQTDKTLGIPGEDLNGSHAATEFVGWYNGHPDYKHLQFDLSQERVAIIGVGNVAMDVARILARTPNELNSTDIAPYAQEALAKSNIKEIYVFGRRGAAQAAFTNPEIKELGEMEGADCLVLPDEVTLDDVSKAYLSSGKAEAKDSKNVDILQQYAQHAITEKPKHIHMRFLCSPVELLGENGNVSAIKIARTALSIDDNGDVKARATDQIETIPVGLVFRSVGYRGVALPDVPFDDKRGVIPNEQGRIIREGAPVVGEYVSGWIKRGPSGVIGTNKPDSVETSQKLLEDVQAGVHWQPTQPSADAIVSFLDETGVEYTSFADWLQLDALEQERGAQQGRPRVKFTDVNEMLSVIKSIKERS
jgi:ferredoxin/flavodoxin---NADP+ reductase